MSDRDKILRVFKSKVNEQTGHTIDHAVNMRAMDIPRLLTGSLSFDFALGGGIPVGRTIIFRGPESSGKTTNALRIAGLAQNLCSHCLREVDDLKVIEIGHDTVTGKTEYAAEATCNCYTEGLFEPRQFPDENDKDYKARLKRYRENSYEEFRVVFVDFEGTFDSAWARANGVDERRLLRVVPSTGEEGVDIYDELLRTGAIDLFILDSIAAMTPSKEVEASAEDDQVGLQARLVNSFVRKVTTSGGVVEKDFGFMPTQIWINQEREMIGGSMFGDNTTMPGGKGQKFGASVTVKMWASKWDKAKFDEDLKKDFQIDIATEVRQNFKVEKNKCLVGGTLVFDVTRGRFVELEDCCGVDFNTLGYCSGEIFESGVERVWMQKKKSKVYRVILENGDQVCGNSRHPLLGTGGWKNIGELMVGDYVGVPRRVNLPLRSSLCVEDARMLGYLIGDGVVDARMLGYLIGDGSVTGATSPVFINKNEIVIEDLKYLVSRHDCELHKLKNGKMHYSIRNVGGGRSGRVNSVTRMLKMHDVWGKVAWKKEVPQGVLYGVDESKWAFLEGLVLTDGNVHKDRICFNTTSKKLAQGVRLLLLSLGVESSLQMRARRIGGATDGRVIHGGRDVYVVSVMGDDALLWAKRFDVLGEREEALTKLRSSNFTQRKRVPSSYARSLVEYAKIKGVTLKYFIEDCLGRKYGSKSSWGGALSIRGEVASLRRVEALEMVLFDGETKGTGVSWVKVKDIVPEGVADVFDLSAPETKSFLADMVVVHNTAPAKMMGGFILKIAGSRAGEVDEMKYVIQQAMKYGYYAEKEEGRKKTWVLGDEVFDKKGSVLARMEQPEVKASLKKALLAEMIKGLNEA